MDFVEDCLSFGFPDVALWVVVAVGEIGQNGIGQLLDAGEASMSDAVCTDVAEEAFDQIHPRGGGGREVHREARMPSQPPLHLGMFVGRVIIGNEMDREVFGRFPVDLLQETQPLDMCVSRLSATDNFSFQIMKRRKQRGGSVAIIIVRLGADMPNAKRQAGLCALPCLTLALRVAAQNQCVFRRMERQANHVPAFFFEARIVGKLARAGEVRFDGVGCPKPLYGCFRYASGMGHLAA